MEWMAPAPTGVALRHTAVVMNCSGKELQKPNHRQSFIDGVSDPGRIELLLSAIDEQSENLQSAGSRHCKMLLKKIVQRVDFARDNLTGKIDIGRAFHRAENLSDIELPTLEIATRIKLARRGGELKLILKGAVGDAANLDPNLIKTLRDARRRYRSYTAETETTLSQIASNDDTDTADVSRSLQLAFIAPVLVGAILDGRQQTELSATKLKRLNNLPLLWEDQRALFG